MRRGPVRGSTAAGLFSLSLFLFFPPIVQAQAIPAETLPEQVTTVRSITTGDFHESFRDRMSGGLRQQFPFRMTADSQGRFFVTEPFLGLIQVLDTKLGKRWQIRGDRTQRMVMPTYIAVDSDENIYVSEPLLGAVLVFQPDGHFMRAIGVDHLEVPFGLALDAAHRRLYVVDHYRDEIQVYSLEGQLLGVMASPGTGAGQLLKPCDLVLHDGMLFVLDGGNERFQIFDTEGNSKGSWPFGRDRLPIAFAFDTKGNLFYVDRESRGMLISDPGDRPLAEFDVKNRYGQPGGRNTLLSFNDVTQNPDGSMVALRPALEIEVLKLEPNAVPPRSDTPAPEVPGTPPAK